MSLSGIVAVMLVAGVPASTQALPVAAAQLPVIAPMNAPQPEEPAPSSAEPLQAAASVDDKAASMTEPTTAPTSPSSDVGSPQNAIVITARREHAAGDPLQGINAKSFAVTQSVDAAVVRPIALAYEHAVPKPIRNGIRNFLENLHEPIVFLNFLIQLKPGKAVETVGRFGINSTIGGAGLFDIAKRHPFNLPLRRNGFADSLGYYGVKPGPFLFLPLIGPTTLRDLLGGGIDRLVLPSSIGAPFNQPVYTIPVGAVSELDRRAQLDGKLRAFRKSDDPYVTRRAFYLMHRQSEIDRLHSHRAAGSGQQATGRAPSVQHDLAECEQNGSQDRR